MKDNHNNYLDMCRDINHALMIITKLVIQCALTNDEHNHLHNAFEELQEVFESFYKNVRYED